MCDKAHYDDLETRVTSLEGEVNELRSETRTGFSAVNANIETLSQQLTNMDARIVEEKVKWGGVFRSLVSWVVKAGIIIICAACGVNSLPEIVKVFH